MVKSKMAPLDELADLLGRKAVLQRRIDAVINRINTLENAKYKLLNMQCDVQYAIDERKRNARYGQ